MSEDGVVSELLGGAGVGLRLCLSLSCHTYFVTPEDASNGKMERNPA